MNSNKNLKKTALYDQHVKLNAKLIEFGEWLLPVSFEGSIIEEHKTVREKCGLFDVSHMGEVRVKGPDAGRFLQYITFNDVSSLSPRKGHYTGMINESGGMIDDLILYQLAADEYFLVINASNIEKDVSWIEKHAKAFHCSVSNESSRWSQIAVQGPNCFNVVSTLLTSDEISALSDLSYMGIMPCSFFNQQGYIGRTGYTGELGFELYLENSTAIPTWTSMLATAAKTGVKPIGLGARDTLRLESCYLLYGNDMNETISPLEAGISWAIRKGGGDFIGKSSLDAQRNLGVSLKTIGFKLEEPGIARHDMKIFKNNVEIGLVTSGSFLPTLGFSGGMARIESKAAAFGDKVEIDIRGKRKTAQIMKKPLYTPKVK